MRFKLFENFNSFEIKILDRHQLFDIIYEDGMPKDPTVFKRIRYFSPEDFSYWQHKVNAFYVAMFDKDKLIGLAKCGYFDLTAQNERTYSISFFSIDKDYRKKGLSRLMCDALFKAAKEKGYEISTSSYTFVGKKFLKPLFNEYAKKYDVTFYDKNEEWSIMDAERDYVPYNNTIIHQNELDQNN